MKTNFTLMVRISVLSSFFVTGVFAQTLVPSAQTTNQTISQTTIDPYLWLEEVQGEKALDWVKARNAETRAKLEQDTGFVQLRGELETILNSKDRIPYIQKMGKFVYNFWTDAAHPKGLWRRTSLKNYRQAEVEWETVLDIDAIAKAENESWVFKGSNCRAPVYDRCLIQLSRGGADAVTLREFDLQKKEFLRQGFVLPESKMNVDWRDLDTLFIGTDFGADSMTDSGYPRRVKEWKRGTAIADARLIFEGKKDDISVSASSYEHGKTKYEIVHRAITFYTSESFLIRGSRLEKLDLPAKGGMQFFGTSMLLTPNEDWTVGGHTFISGSVLAINFEAFLKGSRDFFILYTPSEKTSFSTLVTTRDYVLIEGLDDVKSSLSEWHFSKGQWRTRKVNLPTMGAVAVTALDSEKSNDYLLSYSDYLSPSVLQLAHAGNDQRIGLKSAPAFFDASAYQTEQFFAKSKDGTQIPYFMVHQKDLKNDGSHPTLLYGYGGFQISLTPTYSGGIGKAWLEKGGVYVVANIRGGGEYGPRWHQAALKENRQRAYDDFAAVAEDLVARQITSPAHLGAMGGSNGGLLAGVTLTQHPELFNAVVSQVPLLDMQRFNKLLAGASWMGEYGNPDVPAEWAFISQYSPYQNLKAAQKYPNVLFITSTRDDRVHPGHARKMAAKMLEQGHQGVWYYENIEGGHGGAANNAQKADMSAITYSFLWNMLK